MDGIGMREYSISRLLKTAPISQRDLLGFRVRVVDASLRIESRVVTRGGDYEIKQRKNDIGLNKDPIDKSFHAFPPLGLFISTGSQNKGPQGPPRSSPLHDWGHSVT